MTQLVVYFDRLETVLPAERDLSVTQGANHASYTVPSHLEKTMLGRLGSQDGSLIN